MAGKPQPNKPKSQSTGVITSTNNRLTMISCATKDQLLSGGFSTEGQSSRPRSIQSTYTRTPVPSVFESHKSILEMKETARKSRAECDISESTSHTQFFKKPRHEETYARITTDEFFGVSESISGSSDTFQCIHGTQGKIYSEKGLLKRNLVKLLDPIPNESRWINTCNPNYDWDIVPVLKFLVLDATVEEQKERLKCHLQDFVKISSSGYKIEHLESICIITDFLVESLPKNPDRRDITKQILQNMIKPIELTCVVDIVKYNDQFVNYFGFLGYLLMRLEENSMFDLVSEALIWHLSAPDKLRESNSARHRNTLTAAAPMLFEIATRMLAVTSPHRFKTFQTIVLLLACDSQENCIELMRLNILENLFYRFNPYFPDRRLPVYDINPDDPQDINVKLGDSSVHMSSTMTILLVLLKATKEYLAENPKEAFILPYPDSYAQRCFIWAFRYECRAREHRHQREMLVTIALVLVHCFGSRLQEFSEHLMPDILSLSVLTELPPRDDWTSLVNFDLRDVQFKKLLIHFSTYLIKTYPLNRTIIESRHFLLGLMYLVDPGLCYIRTRWAPSLFAELRKTTLQALVCTIPRLDPILVEQYGLVRRTMWYVEWYSESPYELSILYWCLRLLVVCTYKRGDQSREASIKSLIETHGIIILIHLCHTLLLQKTPPLEKAQVIIALSLRLLTSSVESNTKISCCVYPNIKWPEATNSLAKRMIDVVLYSLEKHFIVSDRWLVAVLNFIWEAIIWNEDYREKFIVKDGIYKLLDIVTMTRPPVQCIALGIVCDATRAGDAVGQLVTWRAGLAAAYANPSVVKRGSTIATLLASIFRNECEKTGVQLALNGVITELESPIMSSELRERLDKYKERETLANPTTPLCAVAADMAGSRLSKVYAILSMLSEDLEYKVSLADEAYNLYKNIPLEPEDEAVLVLCAHYLTLKLNEVWVETKVENIGFLRHDEDILEEFLHIGRGWAKEIKRLQEEVLKKDSKKRTEDENSLYDFLARVRLNTSLDALQEARCVARSADRTRMMHSQIQDAVRAHHRRSTSAKILQASVIKTYEPPLDDQHITGQNVKVFSIRPKKQPKKLEPAASSS